MGRWFYIWLLGVLFFLFLFFFYVTFINNGVQNIYYKPSFWLTTRYSLAQMQEFALKNSLANNYRLNLSNRTRISFNRLFKNKEYRLNFLFFNLKKSYFF